MYFSYKYFKSCDLYKIDPLTLPSYPAAFLKWPVLRYIYFDLMQTPTITLQIFFNAHFRTKTIYDSIYNIQYRVLHTRNMMRKFSFELFQLIFTENENYLKVQFSIVHLKDMVLLTP